VLPPASGQECPLHTSFSPHEFLLPISEVFGFPDHGLGLRASYPGVVMRFGDKRSLTTSREREGHGMSADSAVGLSGNPVWGKLSAVRAIVLGGLIAGTLDLTQAFILFGRKVPLVIAAGLLGPSAFQGGAGTYALGVCLHFFIAGTATAVYYSASRRLSFLKEHPLVCGLFYGMAVELVMSYVVLPLSALHDRGPYELHDVLQGLLVHMFVVGLPISFSVRRFGR
jgi:Na+/alanine symporter